MRRCWSQEEPCPAWDWPLPSSGQLATIGQSQATPAHRSSVCPLPPPESQPAFSRPLAGVRARSHRPSHIEHTLKCPTVKYKRFFKDYLQEELIMMTTHKPNCQGELTECEEVVTWRGGAAVL